MTEQAAPPLMNVTQAAARLHISPRAVLHRIAKGHIAAQKIGDGRTSAYVIAEDEIQRVKAEPTA